MRVFQMNNLRRRWLIVSLMISVAYFILVGGMPSLAPLTPHDDTLFQKLAFKIANGDWLGQTYSSQTLAKGVFHSIQMSFAYRLGIPIGLWFHALYLVSTWLFCTLALPGISIWFRALCYLSFLFDPWQFTSFGIRLLREETFVPFLLFAITFYLAALDQIKSYSQRLSDSSYPNKTTYLLLLLSGFSFGLLLVTREARIYVYLLTIFASFAFFINLIKVYGLNRRAISISISLIFVFNVLSPIPLLLTSLRNYSAYDLFISNEFEDGQFKKFYQDLISIKVVDQTEKPWVPLQLETIIKIQELSTGTNLSNVLTDLNPGWQKFGCEQHPEACGEYGGGWLMWALRDSIFMQPSVKSPQTFQLFVQELRRDIKFVCIAQSKEFDCSSRALGYLPHPSRWGHDRSNISLLATDFLIKVKGAFLPSLISYPPALFDESAAQSKWAPIIGVYTAHSSAEQLLWNQRVRDIFRFSEFIRLALASICGFLLILNWRNLKKIIKDPAVVFAVSALALQTLILSLIELTSFHAGGYIILASPILTIVLCRMITALHASHSEVL